MLGVEHLIHIEEVPLWTLFVFGIGLVAGLTWTVRWILRAPSTED